MGKKFEIRIINNSWTKERGKVKNFHKNNSFLFPFQQFNQQTQFCLSTFIDNLISKQLHAHTE